MSDVKTKLKETMLDSLGDVEFARKVNEAWSGTEEAMAASDEHAKGLIADHFAKEIMPKIDEIVAEAEKKAAEGAYTPPSVKGLSRLDKGIEGIPKAPFFLSKARNDEDKELQVLNDDLCLLGEITKHYTPEVGRGMRNAYCDSINAPDNVRTLVTGTATGASEWVPTLLSNDLYMSIEDQLVVAAIFPTITLTSKLVNLPTVTGDADVYYVDGSTLAEGGAVTEDASVLSGDVSFTAKKLVTKRRWSDELDADGIVPAMEILRQKLPRGIARSIDLAVINGDTGTHHDADIAALAATDPRKAWIGLREKALTDSTANADLGTLTLNTLSAIPAAMGKFAEVENLALLVGNKFFWTQLPVLVDSSGNTVFLPGTFGSNAGPVVSGFTGIHLQGVPVMLSTLIRQDLNASGVQDGVTEDNSVVYYVNREAWRLGTRKTMTVEVARGQTGVEGGYSSIVATWRGDFEHMESTNLTTAIGYNVDAS